MKKTHLAASLAAVAITGLALAGCTGGGNTAASGDPASAGPDTLKIGNFLDVTSWDPANADIGFDGPYLSAIYDTLVALDKNGNPVPAVAQKWTVAADGKTITFDLRAGIKFSDGETLDAAAVVKSLEYLKKGARSGEAYKNVTAVKATDDHTVEVDLSTRDDTILYLMGLGRGYIMAPKSIDAGTLAKSPVGSGPYTLSSSSTAGSDYKFDQVKGYWDAKQYPWKSVEIFPIMDATARQNAMLSGQINVQYGDVANLDAAKQNSWNVASRVSGWAGLEINDHTGAQLKPLGDVRVRQALNYAFDGAGILKAVGSGAGVATNQVFPDGAGINDPALNDMYKYNVAKAKELMSQAGYANGFSLHMPMSPVFQAWQAVAAQSLKAIGVTVTWDNMQQPDYQLNAGKYPMFIAFLALDGNANATVFRNVSGAQWFNPNPDYAKVPSVKAAVDKVNTTSGDAQTQAIKDLNTELTKQAWWSVWYQADNTYYSAQGIKVQPIIGMMFPTLRYITQG
ncbi:hypothetical protein LK09_18935 [Microbacterium mangrovi]|uniref:Solute-binding protein family 5 domain-containing protein n=1 Tax=Microbacterium mangrovi TaxID=1348253 RepID=A0A0B2A0Y3_9MICO|nr:ABC transporter substrate-binding protein [Microbacterium mangrovi]KHK95472.1 hypothetical protein LK09_18935 [Microbacterium mangrovi]